MSNILTINYDKLVKMATLLHGENNEHFDDEAGVQWVKPSFRPGTNVTIVDLQKPLSKALEPLSAKVAKQLNGVEGHVMRSDISYYSIPLVKVKIANGKELTVPVQNVAVNASDSMEA